MITIEMYVSELKDWAAGYILVSLRNTEAENDKLGGDWRTFSSLSYPVATDNVPKLRSKVQVQIHESD